MGNICRILIVDDEFIMRQGIRFMMKWQEAGCEIVGEASNGKEALELIPELEPHIILCDIAMPVMNGLDFIKVVRCEYPDIQIVVLSGYDYFDYVREALLNGAVDYVLKPTINPDELLKILGRAAGRIPDLQLGNREMSDMDVLLENYMTDREEKEDRKTEQILSEAFPHSCCRLFILPLGKREPGRVSLSPILFEKIQTFLEGLEYCRFLKFIWQKDIMCAVLNYDVRDEARLLNDLRQFMDQLGAVFEKALGTLGKAYRRLRDVRRELLDSGQAEQESFYNRGVHLCLAENTEERPAIQRFDFQGFTALILSHRYYDAAEKFREYIHMAAECRLPEFKLKNQAKNLLFNLLIDPEEQARDLENLRKGAFEKIDAAPYREEFLKIFDEVIDEAEELLQAEEDNKNLYMRKIMEYIRQHYAEELNLHNIADKFNFSYSYLSAYFSQHVSEGFSEYLNRIRVEKACEFLKDSRYPISQVSAKVGYSDHSYFCRVFKKITGRTPSAYRRENL